MLYLAFGDLRLNGYCNCDDTSPILRTLGTGGIVGLVRCFGLEIDRWESSMDDQGPGSKIGERNR